MRTRNNEIDARRTKAPGMGLERFTHLGSGIGFRRHQRSVNGGLMGFLRLVRGPQSPIPAKEWEHV